MYRIDTPPPCRQPRCILHSAFRTPCLRGRPGTNSGRPQHADNLYSRLLEPDFLGIDRPPRRLTVALRFARPSEARASTNVSGRLGKPHGSQLGCGPGLVPLLRRAPSLLQPPTQPRAILPFPHAAHRPTNPPPSSDASSAPPAPGCDVFLQYRNWFSRSLGWSSGPQVQMMNDPILQPSSGKWVWKKKNHSTNSASRRKPWKLGLFSAASPSPGRGSSRAWHGQGQGTSSSCPTVLVLSGWRSEFVDFICVPGRVFCGGRGESLMRGGQEWLVLKEIIPPNVQAREIAQQRLTVLQELSFCPLFLFCFVLYVSVL